MISTARHMFRLVVYPPPPSFISSTVHVSPLLTPSLPRRNRTTGHTHYQRRTHQLVRIDHSKLQLLHAAQAGRGVTEVLRGHAQGRGPDAGGGWGAGAATHGLLAVGFPLPCFQGEEKMRLRGGGASGGTSGGRNPE